MHCSPELNGVSGCEREYEGPPETVAVWSPLAEQWIVNQAVSTFTGSEKFTTRSVGGIDPRVHRLAGTVEATLGAASPPPPVRGVGAPVVKSATLLSVSVAPAALAQSSRRVCQRRGRPRRPRSSSQCSVAHEVDEPGRARTESAVCARDERDLARASPPWRSLPVAFGRRRQSCRRCLLPPGRGSARRARVEPAEFVFCHVVPADAAYCTDQP